MPHPVPDEPTRDITLPPLPGRPVALPPGWAAPAATAAAGAPEAAARVPLADQPTDQLVPPGPPRQPTRPFAAPGAPEAVAAGQPRDQGSRPRAGAPAARERHGRAWPWVLLSLLAVLVVVGTAVALFLLLAPA
jgi:hypothetical protein